jgi:hypothetical protein
MFKIDSVISMMVSVERAIIVLLEDCDCGAAAGKDDDDDARVLECWRGC